MINLILIVVLDCFHSSFPLFLFPLFFFLLFQAQEKSCSSSTKKKSKFVNLYNKDGQDKQVILLPGRHPCECLAQKHKLINNCINCGRIACEQEGSGPCLFCGSLVRNNFESWIILFLNCWQFSSILSSLISFLIQVCTREEQEILQRDSNKSQKLRKKLMGGERPKLVWILKHKTNFTMWIHGVNLFLFWWQTEEKEITSNTKRPKWRLAWRRLYSTKKNCWNMTRIGIKHTVHIRVSQEWICLLLCVLCSHLNSTFWLHAVGERNTYLFLYRPLKTPVSAERRFSMTSRTTLPRNPISGCPPTSEKSWGNRKRSWENFATPLARTGRSRWTLPVDKCWTMETTSTSTTTSEIILAPLESRQQGQCRVVVLNTMWNACYLG